jgi:hypothetical protein
MIRSIVYLLLIFKMVHGLMNNPVNSSVIKWDRFQLTPTLTGQRLGKYVKFEQKWGIKREKDCF